MFIYEILLVLFLSEQPKNVFLNKKCSKNNNASHCVAINHQAYQGCFNLNPNIPLYNSCVETIAILGGGGLQWKNGMFKKDIKT